MTALPTMPSSTGQSWEVVETIRAHAALHVDQLIESIAVCDCGNAADGLWHYDGTHVIITSLLDAEILPAMLAEALVRLGAARKAGLL